MKITIKAYQIWEIFVCHFFHPHHGLTCPLKKSGWKTILSFWNGPPQKRRSKTSKTVWCFGKAPGKRLHRGWYTTVPWTHKIWCCFTVLGWKNFNIGDKLTGSRQVIWNRSNYHFWSFDDIYCSNIYTHLTAWCLVISKGAFRMATMTSKWATALGLSTGHLIIVMWRRFTYYVNFEAEYIVLSHIHPRKHANDLDGFYRAPLQNCSFSYLCHTVQECDFIEYDTLFFPQTDGWVEVSMKVLCNMHESTDFNRNNW